MKKLVGILVVALLLGACGTSKISSSPPTSDVEGEVFLEPASDRGTDPFTDSVSRIVGPGSAAAQRGGEAIEGTTSGLYGGSQDNSACDKKQLIEFLENNPDKASAWATVQGIELSEISAFVAGMADVVLTSDTRVTNHGFVDGRATPRQSLLEAGTAVLVDETGLPRVRCACGNPLAEAEPTSSGPHYEGTAWVSFDSDLVIVIVSGAPVVSLTVVDVGSGERFELPVGTEPDSAPAVGEPGVSLCELAEYARDRFGGGFTGSYFSDMQQLGADLVPELQSEGAPDSIVADAETVRDKLAPHAGDPSVSPDEVADLESVVGPALDRLESYLDEVCLDGSGSVDEGELPPIPEGNCLSQIAQRIVEYSVQEGYEIEADEEFPELAAGIPGTACDLVEALDARFG